MRKATPLTDARVRNAKPTEKAYRLFDGAGLYLEVKPNGSRYWRLKYRLGGKEKLLALGVYPKVSLAEARRLTTEARQLISVGRDPITERRALRMAAATSAGNTFEAIAREWIDSRSEKWAPSYAEKVSKLLEANLYPRIGALPITEINAPLLLAALKPIEARGALEVASRARKLSGEIFRYAIATGRAGADPTVVLKGALKTAQPKHYPALKRDELGPFLRKLAEYTGRPETRIAINLLALTFVRPGELRAAQWEEFDFERKEWRIPAERMKGRTEHIVPLARQAVALLRELQPLTGHSPYLFPSLGGRAEYISEVTINKALGVIGYKGRATGHGFRATASTILNESGKFHHDAIERQLSHKERNKIRAAYHRAEYLPERKRMMQWWADFLDSTVKGADVVPLRERSRPRRG